MTPAAAIALTGWPSGRAEVLTLSIVGMIVVLIIVVLVLVLRAARDGTRGFFNFEMSASLLKGTFRMKVESQRSAGPGPDDESAESPPSSEPAGLPPSPKPAELLPSPRPAELPPSTTSAPLPPGQAAGAATSLSAAVGPADIKVTGAPSAASITPGQSPPRSPDRYEGRARSSMPVSRDW